MLGGHWAKHGNVLMVHLAVDESFGFRANLRKFFFNRISYQNIPKKHIHNFRVKAEQLQNLSYYICGLGSDIFLDISPIIPMFGDFLLFCIIWR
jgi:hypothetical protein